MKAANLWIETANGAAATVAAPRHETAAVERRAEPARVAAEVTQLFDELRSPVVRYLLSMGLSAADGDEIAQEVFLALFRHLRRGGPRSNLRGWVFRVAHNQALKRRSANFRRKSWPAGDTDAVDPAPDPEQRAAASQRQRRMLAIARALPEQDQRCLSLRAEGLRYREIAKVLGISLGAVSLSLRRSLTRLSQADR